MIQNYKIKSGLYPLHVAYRLKWLCTRSWLMVQMTCLFQAPIIKTRIHCSPFPNQPLEKPPLSPIVHSFFSWWKKGVTMATKPFFQLSFLLLCLSFLTKSQAKHVAALYIFGDSDLDNGNNNDKDTLAKANYPPYGIDYPKGTTGRFTNGLTIADYLGKFKVDGLIYWHSGKIKLMIWNAAQFLNINQPPPFLGPMAATGKRPRGYNYASASAGILPETGTIVVTQHLLSTLFVFSNFLPAKLWMKIHAGLQLEPDRAGEVVQKNRGYNPSSAPENPRSNLTSLVKLYFLGSHWQ